ncbi:hypothetical protein BaRGS_00018391, partial [Batillaria attramentaria]
MESKHLSDAHPRGLAQLQYSTSQEPNFKQNCSRWVQTLSAERNFCFHGHKAWSAGHVEKIPIFKQTANSPSAGIDHPVVKRSSRLLCNCSFTMHTEMYDLQQAWSQCLGNSLYSSASERQCSAHGVTVGWSLSYPRLKKSINPLVHRRDASAFPGNHNHHKRLLPTELIIGEKKTNKPNSLCAGGFHWGKNSFYPRHVKPSAKRQCRPTAVTGVFSKSLQSQRARLRVLISAKRDILSDFQKAPGRRPGGLGICCTSSTTTRSRSARSDAMSSQSGTRTTPVTVSFPPGRPDAGYGRTCVGLHEEADASKPSDLLALPTTLREARKAGMLRSTAYDRKVITARALEHVPEMVPIAYLRRAALSQSTCVRCGAEALIWYRQIQRTCAVLLLGSASEVQALSDFCERKGT